MNRRNFIKLSTSAGITFGCGLSPYLTGVYSLDIKDNLSRVEAKFYEKHPDKEIECVLCPRNCKIGSKERGYCGVRENIEGIYYTLVYGKVCSIHADPIEKKPFFHFLPKSLALSIATAGCNVNCKFCQNWEISQVRPEQIRHMDLPPENVVRSAQKNGCPVIAYTYSEPVVFYEYMYDTSVKARKENLKNVVVTGGHINKEPLEKLIRVVDAIKVDLKSFSSEFYEKFVRGQLQPVLDAIKTIAKTDVWLEIVYLVIPTLNDNPREFQEMCHWIVNEIGPDVPLHFSRFYPSYLLKNLPPTPISTLERARQIALQTGIHYSYIGNVPGHMGENTFCPHCESIVVQRKGYQIQKINLRSGKCTFCDNAIPGVWEN